MLGASVPLSLAAAEQTRRQAIPQTPGQPTRGAGRLTQAAFAACINTIFRIEREHAPAVPLRLIELNGLVPEEAQAQAERLGQESFALAFRAPRDQALTQATYHFKHQQLGQFDLFIVPLKNTRDEHLYAAIINHLHV